MFLLVIVVSVAITVCMILFSFGYGDFSEVSSDTYKKISRYYEQYPEVREYVDKISSDKITNHQYAVILGIVVKISKENDREEEEEKKAKAKEELSEAKKRNHM